ncbi:MAG TPA: hypothetical protein VF170_13820 [Planctomycetaceae bacterium]
MRRGIAVVAFMLGGLAVAAGLLLSGGVAYFVYTAWSVVPPGADFVAHDYAINDESVSATTFHLFLFGTPAALLLAGGGLILVGLALWRHPGSTGRR